MQFRRALVETYPGGRKCYAVQDIRYVWHRFDSKCAANSVFSGAFS